MKSLFPYSSKNNNSSLQDLFGAASLNRIGAGHGIKYYKNQTIDKITHESYAQMVSLYSSKDRRAWEYAEKHLPNLAGVFRESLL